MTLADVNILEVWRSLGGGKLIANRGQAFWRRGDGYSIALDAKKGVYFDHRDAVGGGVLDFVQMVLGCSQHNALQWLEENVGLDSRKPVSRAEYRKRKRERERNRRERDDAECFGIAAAALAEEVLERMSDTDIRREVFTQLRAIIRLGSVALITELRLWHANHRELTAGLVRAGAASRARMQQRLALFIQGELTRAA